MTPNEISRSSLLDLLFEHRNKQYGAYVLRKYYNNRLGIAIASMLALVLLALFLMNVLAGKPGRGFLPPERAIDVVLGRAPSPEPEPIDPPKPTRSSAPVATRQWTNQIVLTPDDNTVPDQRTLEHSAIGVTTIEGPQGPGFQGAPDPGPAATAPAPAPIEPAPVVEELPSAPPSFPGGMKAWTEFLVRNLIPSSDMQPGEKRSVLVRFWVDEDGAVGRFEIMQSGGHGFDNEVLRVLRKMPRWKPALQRGRAVATSFVQPVTFQAPEE